MIDRARRALLIGTVACVLMPELKLGPTYVAALMPELKARAYVHWGRA